MAAFINNTVQKDPQYFIMLLMAGDFLFLQYLDMMITVIISGSCTKYEEGCLSRNKAEVSQVPLLQVGLKLALDCGIVLFTDMSVTVNSGKNIVCAVEPLDQYLPKYKMNEKKCFET